MVSTARCARRSDIRQPVTVSVVPRAVFADDAHHRCIPPWWQQMAKSASSKDRLLGKVVEFCVSEDRSSARLRFIS